MNLDTYLCRMVHFLGSFLGPDYEIALFSLKKQDEAPQFLCASGYNQGESLFREKDLEMLEIVLREDSEIGESYLIRLEGGRMLRSALLPIRDDRGKAELVLLLRFDDSRYRSILEQVLRLCHPDRFVEEHEKIDFAPLLLLESETTDKQGDAARDTLLESITAVVQSSTNPPERMSQQEKEEIVDRLYRRAVFEIKGAVPQVAETLRCSSATVYRYLARVKGRQDTSAES